MESSPTRQGCWSHSAAGTSVSPPSSTPVIYRWIRRAERLLEQRTRGELAEMWTTQIDWTIDPASQPASTTMTSMTLTILMPFHTRVPMHHHHHNISSFWSFCYLSMTSCNLKIGSERTMYISFLPPSSFSVIIYLLSELLGHGICVL